MSDTLNKQMKKAANMNEMVDDLTEVFTDLRNGEINIEAAREMHKTTTAITRSIKIQLEFHKMVGTTPSIPFFSLYQTFTLFYPYW